MRRSFAPGLVDDEVEVPSEIEPRIDELRTEFAFVLPRGYLDRSGQLHRHGVMAA